MTLSLPTPAEPAVVVLGRYHMRRLREVYRSAGWPCHDMVEVELLAAGLLERVRDAAGRETLRLTDAGITRLSQTLAANRAVRTNHERLALKVAREMLRAGRIVWRELSLRAQVPAAGAVSAVVPTALMALASEGGWAEQPLPSKTPMRWCIAKPDVFSIRNTSVEAYAQPVVHEVKVSRADLLGDLRKPDKRAAYLDLGGECWYVLGRDAKDRPIASPNEIPLECGVLIDCGERLEVARAAVRRIVPRLPFAVWLALAKAQPMPGFDDDAQALLNDEEG